MVFPDQETPPARIPPFPRAQRPPPGLPHREREVVSAIWNLSLGSDTFANLPKGSLDAFRVWPLGIEQQIYCWG